MAEPLPLSVWPCAQRQTRLQRAGRYLPGSVAHPAKMLPDIARYVIEAYTQPRDLVFDPMCGIGTTLVEAIYLGRHALGIEYESRWADLADANIALAEASGAPGRGDVIVGDARRLHSLVPASMRARISLVLTSPPYGDSVHGHVEARPGGVLKRNHRYSTDAANLAHIGRAQLLTAMTDVLRGCAGVLRPGGVVVLTTRPWRHRGLLLDFPSAVMHAGESVGLIPLQRLVALLAALRQDELVPRSSFFQLQLVRRAIGAGTPLRLIAHEDVLVLRKES